NASRGCITPGAGVDDDVDESPGSLFDRLRTDEIMPIAHNANINMKHPLKNPMPFFCGGGWTARCGAPHCGHAAASVLIDLPHSRHLMSAMRWNVLGVLLLNARRERPPPTGTVERKRRVRIATRS